MVYVRQEILYQCITIDINMEKELDIVVIDIIVVFNDQGVTFYLAELGTEVKTQQVQIQSPQPQPVAHSYTRSPKTQIVY